MHLRRWLSAVPVRLARVFNRSRVDADLDEELSFHLEMETNAAEQRGMSRPEAERLARVALHGVQQTRERTRDVWPLAWTAAFAQDLRYAVRQLIASPVFATVAVLCLSLGIGANTSIFSALNGALFKPFPVRDPDHLLMLRRGGSASFSYPDFKDFQTRSRLMSGLAAAFPMESDLDVNGVSEFIAAEVVSANYGAVLGVEPVIGYWFTRDDEPVAVISYAAWQTRFGGRADIVGRRVDSEAQSYTIAGVAPAGFTGTFGPFRTDLWVPLQTRPALAAILADRTRRVVMAFGRIPRDGSPTQAAAELNALDAQLVAENGARDEPLPPIVAEPIRGIANPGGRRLATQRATLLMIVVSVVLLIACVNVASLLRVRGLVRQRELATRHALGASRARLMRQLLTESMVLAAVGGLLGIVAAVMTTSLLERLMLSTQSTFPSEFDLRLDARVLAFTAVLSVTVTLICGLLPAWRAAQPSATERLKGDVAVRLGVRRPFGLVAQVVMSFLLLLIAGSVIEAFQRLQSTDPGFARDGRLYAYVYFPAVSAPEARLRLYDQTIERLKTLPGVVSVSQSSTLPLMPAATDCVSLFAGPQLRASTNDVDIDYFQTMGIGMVAGREFVPADETQGASTVIVTSSLAERLWPGRAPIGEQLLVGCRSPQASTVVGVARDSAVREVGETPQPRVYRPFTREYTGGISALLLETSSDPTAMVPIVRQSLLDIGQNIRVYAVQPLNTYVEASLAGVRWMALVVAGFGLLALLLAAVGLYGVIAYRVSVRTREIGIRMALGANRRAIFRTVILQGLALTTAGVLFGEVLALPAMRLLGAAQAYVRPAAASTHLAVALIWILVTALACYGPAVRAARITPMEALRHE